MQDTTDVHLHYIPLDEQTHAALVETPETIDVALDSDDPAAAVQALQALLQERFSSGAWMRRPSTES
ncbi:hypothetical protein [Kitasatospora sp. NBC_01302]|uniref:hypothetical protein n=1 Tax=Kitasatospora sp. NBC_01302 TaxID=2903575 RepID=UPI002E1318DF|nr:hypothetical protein OG294_13695 [Kitasatospora sp. NBC_01302]